MIHYSEDKRMLEYGLMKSYPGIFVSLQLATEDIVQENMLRLIATTIAAMLWRTY